MSTENTVRFRGGLARTICVAAFAMTFAASAQANAIYSYVGNTLTSYFPNSIPSGGTLVGQFELAAPIAANLNGLDIFPLLLSYSFTYSGSPNATYSNPFATGFFGVSTDNLAQLTAYNLSLSQGADGYSAQVSGNSVNEAEGNGNGYPAGYQGTNRPTITLVPEPNTGLLVLTGVLGLAYRQRRHGRAA